METISCNLCHSPEFRVRLMAQDYNYATPGTFRVVSCVQCGLSYLNPRPTVAEIGEFYPSSYGEHNSTPQPNAFSLGEAALVRLYHPEAGKILDVGCASGYFLAAMSELGWELFGVEPDELAASTARKVVGSNIKVGVLQPGDFPEDTFDAITLWSVLEHLHDPLNTLKTVRTMLKSSGHLHICIPNFDSLERRLFGVRWFGLDVPRHLYHFGPASIRSLLECAGFRIVSLQHASGHDTLKNSLRRPPRCLSVAAEAGTRDRQHFLDTHSHAPNIAARARRFMNKTIGSTFTRLADASRQGSQMLVVAQPER